MIPLGGAIVSLTVDDRIGRISENLVNELVAESLSDIGRGPEHADWDTTLEDDIGAWTNAGASGDQDHAAEHGNQPEDTTGGNTTDPKLVGRVLDHFGGPVASTRNDEGELVLPRLGDSCESMPFLEGRVGDSDSHTGVRAGYCNRELTLQDARQE